MYHVPKNNFDYSFLKNSYDGPGWYGSIGWNIVQKLKCGGFPTQSRHIQEASNWFFPSVDVSLSFFLSPFLSKSNEKMSLGKDKIKKKTHDERLTLHAACYLMSNRFALRCSANPHYFVHRGPLLDRNAS